MIRRWLDSLVDRFTDTEWLHERRKQEVLARREANHITRKNRLEPPFEGDFFPQAPKRNTGGQRS